MEIEFKGILNKKYLDDKNHMAKTIEMLNGDKKFISTFLTLEQSNFFKVIKEGDSLVKEKESLNMKVVRNSQETDYLLDFMCP